MVVLNNPWIGYLYVHLRRLFVGFFSVVCGGGWVGDGWVVCTGAVFLCWSFVGVGWGGWGCWFWLCVWVGLGLCCVSYGGLEIAG